MNNQTKLINVFASALDIDSALIIDSLEYNSIDEWDSIAHMALIAELEEGFDVMFDTDDIIAMSSPLKAKEILQKYEIIF